MTMFMIELDISHEATEAEVSAEATQFNCKANLVQEIGPAGGNPLYIFESESFDDLHAFASVVLCTEDQSWVDSMIKEFDDGGNLV